MLLPDSYYISTCPDTGRMFLDQVGQDNNICEVFDKERLLEFISNCECKER